MQRMTPFAAFQGIEADPAHSPSTTSPEGGEYGLPFEDSTHRPHAEDNNGGWWAATANQEYITPSIGGKPGPTPGLGWTTGLRPRKERRPPLDGSTLVVPPNQARNPNIGAVGFDIRGATFGQRVEALNQDFLPSLDAIAASFTHQGSSALMREIVALGDA